MQRRRPAGFSLLELALIVVVVSALAAVALDRYLYYQERAEKFAMEETLAMVKMGLQIRLAELIMTNRQSIAAQLERENPMQWLDPPPNNYFGDYVSPAKHGNWYYSAAEHELVYVPSSRSKLDIDQSALKELRYRVVIQFEPNLFTGRPLPIGVSLVPSRSFKWF
jgi:type II secretory pathway pseudopilin PulG